MEQEILDVFQTSLHDQLKIVNNTSSEVDFRRAETVALLTQTLVNLNNCAKVSEPLLCTGVVESKHRSPIEAEYIAEPIQLPMPPEKFGSTTHEEPKKKVEKTTKPRGHRGKSELTLKIEQQVITCGETIKNFEFKHAFKYIKSKNETVADSILISKIKTVLNSLIDEGKLTALKVHERKFVYSLASTESQPKPPLQIISETIKPKTQQFERREPLPIQGYFRLKDKVTFTNVLQAQSTGSIAAFYGENKRTTKGDIYNFPTATIIEDVTDTIYDRAISAIKLIK